MVLKTWSSLIFALLLALILPVSALANQLLDGRVIIGEDFTLHSGEILSGDLVVIDGKATLNPGSVVTHNVAMIGGFLDSSAEISGDVVGIRSKFKFHADAVVKGDVVLFDTELHRAEGADIPKVYHFEISHPKAGAFFPDIDKSRLGWMTKGWASLYGYFFRVFAWTALALLLALLFPNSMETVRRAIDRQPFLNGGLGFLTFLVSGILIVLFTVTLILIPIAFLMVIVGILAWFYGIVGLGLVTGEKLASLLKQNWSTAIKAGAGTFLLVLAVDGVAALIPCVGWSIPFVIGLVGFGSIVMTRFGTFAEV